jgi:predicted permease
MLDNVLGDVKYALRWLRRSPGFAFVAIASLAIGIGFNTALFTLVDALLFRPLPVERPDRLVDVFTSSRDGDQYATTSYPDFIDFRSRNAVFSDMFGFSPSFAAVRIGDRSRIAMGEIVTGSYFDVLGVRALVGRALRPDDDRPGAARAAVISYKLWTREFGASASAIGQPIRIHGQPYTIVGVMPAIFNGMFPLLAPELWTPTAFVDDVDPGGIISTVPSTGNTTLERRGYRWLFVKGRLKSDATYASAAANIQLVMSQLAADHPETNRKFHVSTRPTKDVHIHPDADRALQPVALALMIVVGLVLVVACANVASMLLARASGRQKEIGIRLAIGAQRSRLVQQLLSESLVMSALGGLAGLALAWALASVATSIALPIPVPVSLGLRIDVRVLLFTAVVTMIATIAAGLVPALKVTCPDVIGELTNDVASTQAAGRRWTMRDALVAMQIAVTLVLLVAAGLLTRSLREAQRLGIGFDPDGIALVSAELKMIGYDDARAAEFFERALARVRALPGVQSAALASRTPFAIDHTTNNIFLPGRHGPNDTGLIVYSTRVSPEYFPTLGVSILQGRNFTNIDTPGSVRVAVVNEAMARKHWPNESAVGKRFRLSAYNGREVEVVGICADYKVSTVGEAATPYVHYAVSQSPDTHAGIMVRGRGDAGALLSTIRRELMAMEPDIIFFEQQTMKAQVAATLLPAKFGAVGVSAVGIVAMLLAAIGLYGLIAYSVARRTREIGIRMALGARRGAVVALVMRQGLAIAGAGLAVGVVLALGAARVVAGALYGVSFVDPIAWTAAAATVAVVAALAHIVPARRASSIDPASALRAD